MQIYWSEINLQTNAVVYQLKKCFLLSSYSSYWQPIKSISKKGSIFCLNAYEIDLSDPEELIYLILRDLHPFTTTPGEINMDIIMPEGVLATSINDRLTIRPNHFICWRISSKLSISYHFLYHFRIQNPTMKLEQIAVWKALAPQIICIANHRSASCVQVSDISRQSSRFHQKSFFVRGNYCLRNSLWNQKGNSLNGG